MCVHIIHTHTFNKLSHKTGNLSKYKDGPIDENETKNGNQKEVKNPSNIRQDKPNIVK